MARSPQHLTRFGAWLRSARSAKPATVRTYRSMVIRLLPEDPQDAQELARRFAALDPDHRSPYRAAWRAFRAFSASVVGVTLPDVPGRGDGAFLPRTPALPVAPEDRVLVDRLIACGLTAEDLVLCRWADVLVPDVPLFDADRQPQALVRIPGSRQPAVMVPRDLLALVRDRFPPASDRDLLIPRGAA